MLSPAPQARFISANFRNTTLGFKTKKAAKGRLLSLEEPPPGSKPVLAVGLLLSLRREVVDNNSAHFYRFAVQACGCEFGFAGGAYGCGL